MRRSDRGDGIVECEVRDHPGDTSSANVCNMLTCKHKAVAETIGVFDEAMWVYTRLPWRARPASKRAETS